MKRWTDLHDSPARVPWYLTKGALLAMFGLALALGLCGPLWTAMPWSVTP